jgi:hypothetical protein
LVQFVADEFGEAGDFACSGFHRIFLHGFARIYPD